MAATAPVVAEPEEEAPEPETPRESTPVAASASPAVPAASAAPNSPTWHAGEPSTDPVARVAPLNPAPAGRERLELAVAYLDLGDTTTARDLLLEVVASNDEMARREALQLLRDLG